MAAAVPPTQKTFFSGAFWGLFAGSVVLVIWSGHDIRSLREQTEQQHAEVITRLKVLEAGPGPASIEQLRNHVESLQAWLEHDNEGVYARTDQYNKWHNELDTRLKALEAERDAEVPGDKTYTLEEIETLPAPPPVQPPNPGR